MRCGTRHALAYANLVGVDRPTLWLADASPGHLGAAHPGPRSI